MPLTITWRRPPVIAQPAKPVRQMRTYVRTRVNRNPTEVENILRMVDQGLATDAIAERTGRSKSFVRSVCNQFRPAYATNRVLSPEEADEITARLQEVPVAIVQQETRRGWATLMKLAQEADAQYKLRQRGSPITPDEHNRILELLRTVPVQEVQRSTGRSYDTLRKMAGSFL